MRHRRWPFDGAVGRKKILRFVYFFAYDWTAYLSLIGCKFFKWESAFTGLKIEFLSYFDGKEMCARTRHVVPLFQHVCESMCRMIVFMQLHRICNFRCVDIFLDLFGYSSDEPVGTFYLCKFIRYLGKKYLSKSVGNSVAFSNSSFSNNESVSSRLFHSVDDYAVGEFPKPLLCQLNLWNGLRELLNYP